MKLHIAILDSTFNLDLISGRYFLSANDAKVLFPDIVRVLTPEECTPEIIIQSTYCLIFI